MIKEITKTITEKIKVCDTCNEPATYMCVICSKDICAAHMVVIRGYNNGVYICSQCNEKPFSEIWNKLYMFFNTTITIYPSVQYQWKWSDYAGTGGYYNIIYTPTIIK